MTSIENHYDGDDVVENDENNDDGETGKNGDDDDDAVKTNCSGASAARALPCTKPWHLPPAPAPGC